MGEFYFSLTQFVLLKPEGRFLSPLITTPPRRGDVGLYLLKTLCGFLLTVTQLHWELQPGLSPRAQGAASGEGYPKSSNSSVPAMLAHLGTRGSTSLAVQTFP